MRRDHRIVAAFARKAAAVDWADMRSFNDESRFTVDKRAIMCADFAYALPDDHEPTDMATDKHAQTVR